MVGSQLTIGTAPSDADDATATTHGNPVSAISHASTRRQQGPSTTEAYQGDAIDGYSSRHP
jgi:hypothetical protein